MRITIMLVLVMLGTGATSSLARTATQREEHFHYSGCICHFGYGSSCADSVACASEGGKCLRACVLPKQ